MTAQLLGIDVSTTGCTAVLVDDSGKVLARANREYPCTHPQPLWSEQNPEDWWSAAVEVISEITEKTDGPPDAIGLTGQMHGLVLLDASGAVLRPAILWNDQRTGDQCTRITQLIGWEALIRHTGNVALPGFTAPKILWIREHEPEVYNRIARVLLPKDYVRYRLTNTFATDVTDASGMLLLDVGRRNWSAEILEGLEIPAAWLADVYESPVACARTCGKETGLAEGIPVVAGAGDCAAGAVGTGIFREGLVSASLGTSGVVFAASNSYRPEQIGTEGKLHTFCHAVPGMWHLMGVMLSAAGSLQWYRDTLAPGVSFSDLSDEAGEAPAGCEGLVFLPYLSGERTPHPDPLARGAFVGLTLRHRRAHLTRSVMEGVSFGLCDSLDLIRGLGIDVESVRLTGGGSRSPLWRTMVADVFGLPCASPDISDGAAFGAALLAAVGAEVHADVPSACRKMVPNGEVIAPGDHREQYDRVHARYRALYPALRDEFHSLGGMDT